MREKIDLKTGKDPFLAFNKSDNTMLADVSDLFSKTSSKEAKTNPLYSVSPFGFARDAGLEYIKLDKENL